MPKTSTTKVDFYRVAHPRFTDWRSGRPAGPYRVSAPDGSRADDVMEALCQAHGWSDNEHPTPDEDGIDSFEREHCCGFASVAQLREWFAGWLERLSDAGFQLYHYRVPAEDVTHGRRQSVAGLPNRAYRRMSLLESAA